MARPTKRTPTARERIVAAIKIGATLRRAAAAGGIHYDTLNEWCKDDPEFSDAVKEAEAYRANQALRAIQKAAQDGQWQAAAWYLERRYPHEYGRTVQEQQGEHRIIIERKNDWRSPGSDGGAAQ